MENTFILVYSKNWKSICIGTTEIPLPLDYGKLKPEAVMESKGKKH